MSRRPPATPASQQPNAPAGAAIAPGIDLHGRRVIEDLGLAIDRDGQWFYHGSLIQRKEMVCLFASVLQRDRAGTYWVVTPSEVGRVDVADAPFLAVEMFVAGAGRARRVSFRTNVDEIVEVDAAHPLVVVNDPRTGEPSPYVQLDRGLTARLSRPVFYELVAIAEPVEQEGGQVMLGFWSAGEWFSLGAVES